MQEGQSSGGNFIPPGYTQHLGHIAESRFRTTSPPIPMIPKPLQLRRPSHLHKMIALLKAKLPNPETRPPGNASPSDPEPSSPPDRSRYSTEKEGTHPGLLEQGITGADPTRPLFTTTRGSFCTSFLMGWKKVDLGKWWYKMQETPRLPVYEVNRKCIEIPG
jgi:hypothetical protein